MVKMNEPSFGLLAMKAILAARSEAQREGRQFVLGDGARIIDEMIANLPKPEPEAAPRQRAKAKPLDDEEWILSLEKAPCYAGIDIQKELGKCQYFFASKPVPVEVSRPRFINWLNKAEKTVGFNGRGKSSSFTPPGLRAKWDPDVVPENWHAAVKKLHPTHWETLVKKSWDEFPFSYREEFAKYLGLI